tara:strand:- start:115 stop:1824 length:1710 start_codon:yes stop_codon:yes gene_type:complete
MAEESQEIKKGFSKFLEKFSADNAQKRADDKLALDKQREELSKLKETIESQGGVAEANAEYNKADLAVKLKDLALQKRSATNRGAQEEIEKERQAAIAKQGTFLQKISMGIGGILGNMKDKALAAGKGLMSILKGTLFAGLFILLAKFFQSPMFGQVVDFLTETILPGLITVGKFFMALGTRFIEAFSNIQVEFDKVFGPNKTLSERFSGFLGIFKEGGIIAAGLAGIVLLLKPSLLFSAIKLGIKAFKAALALVGVGVSDQAADLKKSKTRGGKGGKKGLLSKAANLVPKNIGSKAATLGKGLLKGAKFLPGVGLAVTGIMGVFDGVSAGFKEYNAGGDAGDVAREAAAGVVSGLTFGLVSQETISGAFTTIGDKFKTGFNKMKEDTLAGVDKLKDLGVSAKEKLKDVAGGLKEKFDNVSEKVSGFFGDVKGKFTALTDKLPSIKDVGSKIGNFFGFGKKEEKEMAAPLVQFQKERTALVDRIAMLEKKIAESGSTVRRNVYESRLGMREEQLRKLDQSAIAKSMGGDAASTNVVAPQAKVTNNTANTNVSSSSSVVQVDPTLQFALS